LNEEQNKNIQKETNKKMIMIILEVKMRNNKKGTG
jgi:hypothetical protein